MNAPVTDIASTLTLHDGVPIPRLGLGTYQIAEGPDIERAVRVALEAGYRHIDTASIYGNEIGVGRAIRDSGLPRDEVFVTTKLWNDDQRRGNQRQALEASLKRLGMEYVDLYLVHWPVRDRIAQSWEALQTLRDAGKCRSIGVSNFEPEDLDAIDALGGSRPTVNQVELHPRLQQRAVRQACAARRIAVECWAPIMQGRLGDVSELVQIARRLGRSPVQVALRWQLQRGWVTIPKSATPERIRHNADLFDFQLSDADLEAIDRLDTGQRLGPDPKTFSF